MKQIAKALLDFHKKMPKVKRDSINPHYKSKYASLSNILDVVTPLLNDCGMVLIQQPTGINEMNTMLVHVESGEIIQSTYAMTPQRNDPQGLGSAITYQRRYAIGSLLSLNIDEDTDGEPSGKNDTRVEKINGTPVKELKELVAGTAEYDKTAKAIGEGRTSLEEVKKLRKVSPLTETQLVRDSKKFTVVNN